MYDTLKDNFIDAAINYANLTKEQALEIWDDEEYNFIEDCWVEIHNLMANIFDEYKRK